MSSEWLRVMLEEIARKKAEAEAARVEEQKRRGNAQPGAEPGAAPRPGTDRARG